MNLYDILNSLDINSSNEFLRLDYLLKQEDLKVKSLNRYCSLYAYIETYFKKLKVRQTYISFDDMLKELDIYNLFPLNKHFDHNQLMLFSELLLTIFHQSKEYINILEEELFDRTVAIVDNITIICNKLNYNIYYKNDFAYISPKSTEVDEAINCLEDEEDIAIEILHYNHHQLKGDLNSKRKILVQLSSFIEPLLNSKILSKSGYKLLESDTGFYLNNLNIRHNNLDGKKKQQLCIDIVENDELELWYDKTYNAILMCIISEKQVNYHNELKTLKASYGM